jgi:AraC family transcriptional regulator, exoenzyme S synthesis regulatory protein ExsA
MLNIIEALRSPAIAAMLPGIRKFEIGEVLFASFSCPRSVRWEASWAEHDRIVHVLTGSKTLRAADGIWDLGPGDTIFLKKGACFVRQRGDEELCLYMFFIPDGFVRAAVREIAPDLPPLPPPAELRERAITVRDDMGVKAFLHAMTVFFSSRGAPPDLLLKLKLKELIASIVVSTSNPTLSAYLRNVASTELPSIAAIMEANCCHNLPLAAFARLCGRSLSSFKREFRQLYGVAPGGWLIERRLECAAHLLTSTGISVTEIAFECGFEQASHFSRAFKAKFGQTPSEYRENRVAAA